MTAREKWLVRYGRGWVTYFELMDDPSFYTVYLTLRSYNEIADDIPMQQVRLRDL